MVFWAIVVFVFFSVTNFGSKGSSKSNTESAESVVTESTTTEDDVSETEPASETEVAEDNNVSYEYKNALKKAKSYASKMYMSKQGVYDQLTSEYGEGFTADAAQYAIDHLD